jgi:MazG family protein
MSNQKPLEKLIEVVARLRKECPWDRVQTHESLTRYLIEEAFETVEAIESKAVHAIKEELGDVLLQVVLHSEIARETGHFTIDEVAEAICEKMIRRHPHVFGDGEAKDAGHVKANWEKIKAQERSTKKEKSGLLAGVPTAMPALSLSQRYGEKASSVSFDWKDAPQVWTKVKEEIGELEEAMKSKDPAAIRDELGDVFFVLANLARHLGEDSESIAKAGARKFASRIALMEAAATKEGKRLSDYSAEQLELLWDNSKKSSARS